MTSPILYFSLAFVLVQTSCGPAAESRDSMQSRAKVIADSIANNIKISMSEAAAPGPAINVIKVDTPSAKTPSGNPK